MGVFNVFRLTLRISIGYFQVYIFEPLVNIISIVGQNMFTTYLKLFLFSPATSDVDNLYLSHEEI